MSAIIGPNEISSGLLFYLDAGSTKSYPGSGSVWYDLSGNGINFNRQGSPTFTTLGNASCFRFTADNQWFSSVSFTAPSTADATIEAVIYPEADVTAGDRATLLWGQLPAPSVYHSLNKSNRLLSNYWYSKTPEGYFETGAALSNNNWYHTCAVWDKNAGKIYQYLNGVQTSGSTTGNGKTTTTFVIGRETTARQYAGGIAIMRYYSRALSNDEVVQNYTGLRGRFNI